MTIKHIQDSISIREVVPKVTEAKKAPRPKLRNVTFYFDGTGSQTTFQLPNGYYPTQVYNAGLLKREGSTEDYTVKYGRIYSEVIFNSAPGSGSNIDIIAERY